MSVSVSSDIYVKTLVNMVNVVFSIVYLVATMISLYIFACYSSVRQCQG